MVRHKRSRNNGYWFRDGRGWYVTDGKSAKRLCDVEGNHIKNADDKEGAKQAYARYLTENIKEVKQPLQNTLTTKEACEAYLDSIQSWHLETYRMRTNFLFDLCTGFPASF